GIRLQFAFRIHSQTLVAFPEPLELRGQRDAERARLNDGDFAVETGRSAAAVGSDAARVAQILAVQSPAPVIVVKTRPRTVGIVAGQADLQELSYIAAEVRAARADVAPGSADKILVIRECGRD